MPIPVAFQGALLGLWFCFFAASFCYTNGETIEVAGEQAAARTFSELQKAEAAEVNEEEKFKVLAHKPFFKKPPLPKIPIVKKPFPPKPFFKKPLPPHIPIYKKPLPPPVPVFKIPPFKKPDYPPVPVVEVKPFPKKPIFPPLTKFKKPILPPIPVYKKPLPPPIPVYKKPFPDPVFKKPIPTFKKPFPPHPFLGKPFPPIVP
ncbi:proline-rich protein 4 [Pyrus x bretschneideri]|uniref:proline-rich protein 4 n=1 Tax=Pyrus x bretschneideri TaxID=225117 RepID=UPI00202F423C|nr:proline-rich protein 4 [Pyrus x bretschneideri]